MNLSMSKENAILKIFKLIQVKKQQKITIWIVSCGQTKKVSESWLKWNGQWPLSQKVKIIGGVINMYQKVQ